MKVLKWIVLGLIIGYILVSLLSCSPERRMARIIKKNPHLAIKDTLTVSDTTFIKGSSVDSLFVFNNDTITVSDSNQTIKYFYNTVTHKHYIKGDVRDREVIKEIKVPYEKYIIPKKNWWETYKDYIIITILFMIAIFAFKARRKN